MDNQPPIIPPSNIPNNPLITPDPQVSTPAPLEPSPNSKKKFIVIGAVFLALAILGMIAYFVLSGVKEASPEENENNSQSTSSVDVDTSSLEKSYDDFSKAGISEFSADNKDVVIDKFAELSNDFKLEQEFYDDESNHLLALGIAYSASQEQEKDDLYKHQLYHLTQSYLTERPASITDEDESSTLSDQELKDIYSKYKETDLTNEVNKKIDSSDFFTEVDSQLGISASDRKEFEILVMNFTADNSTAFAADMKFQGWVPPVWSQRTDSFNYIVFTKDQAEKFLSGDAEASKGVIQHEYVHSQGYFSRGNYQGFTLEERRAEWYSNNTGAYYDVKQFLIYYRVFSGIDILSMIQDSPTNPAKFYIELYKKLGVLNANQVVAAIPVPYLEDPTTPVTKQTQLYKNYNGPLETAYEIGQKDPDAQEKRMRERVDELIKVLGTKQDAIDNLTGYVAQTYKMEIASQKMLDYIKTSY